MEKSIYKEWKLKKSKLLENLRYMLESDEYDVDDNMIELMMSMLQHTKIRKSGYKR